MKAIYDRIDHAEFAEFWQADTHTVTELAAHYSCSENAIRATAKRLELAPRRPGTKLTSDVGESPTILARGRWVIDQRRRILTWESHR